MDEEFPMQAKKAAFVQAVEDVTGVRVRTENVWSCKHDGLFTDFSLDTISFRIMGGGKYFWSATWGDNREGYADPDLKTAWLECPSRS